MGLRNKVDIPEGYIALKEEADKTAAGNSAGKGRLFILTENVAMKLRPYIPFTVLNTVWRKLDRKAITVLDVGCGKGEAMSFLKKHVGFELVGVDIFSPYLRISKETKSYQDVILADVTHLPFKDSQFDTVICMEVLEHLDKEDGEKLFQELERVTKRQILITTPISKYEQDPFDENPYQEHRHIWQLRELKERGYKVKGAGIRRLLRRDTNSAIFGILRHCIYTLGGFFSYNIPGLGCHAVGEKIKCKYPGGSMTELDTKRNGYPKTTVLIPTLNEEKNMPRIFPKIPAMVTEILIVDGYSQDDTVKVAKEICPQARIIYQKEKGKGDAIRCGIEAATGDIIVILDADDSMDPGDIPRFIEPLLNGYDYAKGSRFLNGGGTNDMPLYRRLADKAFVILVNLLYRTKFTDSSYGYKAFWKKAFKDITLRAEGFEIEAEIDIKASQAGLKITEVSCVEEKRFSGNSKLRSFSDGWRILRTIVGERFYG
jgi:SAM-dependent methyltransferase